MTLPPDADAQAPWASAEAAVPQAAALFYEKLFDAAPHLRPQSRDDIDVRSRSLLELMGVVVAVLDRTATLGAVLARIGRRHGGAGLRPDPLVLVRSVLVETLADGLGDAFTPEVEAAWAEVYGALAATLRAASETSRAAA